MAVTERRHEPPATLRLRFCATCGLLVPAAHNKTRHRGNNSRSSGQWCPGKTVILSYDKRGS